MAYFVVWDEVSSCKKGISPKEAWQGVIQPCIITRWSNERALSYGAPAPGRALIISTPKGYNFFHEMHTYESTDRNWKSYHYDYTQSPYLDVAEIERIKHTIDPIEFASEYLASFADSGNNVFYCFDRRKHITNELEEFLPPQGHEKGEDVHVCIDFNVGELEMPTKNVVNCWDILKWTISSQALKYLYFIEGSTTIPKGSTRQVSWKRHTITGKHCDLHLR
jgi:hypothetical protein